MDMNDYLRIHGYEFCYILQNLKRRMLYFTKQNNKKTGIRHCEHFIVSLIQLKLYLHNIYELNEVLFRYTSLSGQYGEKVNIHTVNLPCSTLMLDSLCFTQSPLTPLVEYEFIEP